MSNNPGQLYAPGLIGVSVTCILYGVTVSQAIFYFRTYPADIFSLKSLVGCYLLLDTVQMALACETFFTWYIICKIPENYSKLSIFKPTFITSVLITYVSTSMVQGVYGWRVYILSNKNKWMSGVIMIFSGIQFLVGMFLIAKFFMDGHMNVVHSPICQIAANIQLVFSALCDLTISCSLVYIFNKSRTGIRSTENVINCFIIYNANVGLITVLVTLCNWAFWLVFPNSFIFIAFHLVSSKIYINSILVTLNARQTVNKHLQARWDVPTNAEDFRMSIFDIEPISGTSPPTTQAE